MKKIIHNSCLITLLLSACTITAENIDVYGLSFRLDNAGFLAGNGLINSFGIHHRQENKKVSGSLSVQLQGGATFKPGDIARYFFFNNDTSMRVGQGGNSSTTDIYSINLLLPQAAVGATETWASTLSASPRLTHFVADFAGMVHFDLPSLRGCFAELRLPVVHAEWDLRLSETSIVSTGTTIPAGYLATLGSGALTAPYTSVISALKGDKIVGEILLARQYGNVDGKRKKTKFGDGKLTLGYYLVQEDKTQLGVGLVGLFNGDNKSSLDAHYLATPVIGTNARHGVGVQFNGAHIFYERNDKMLTLGFKADVIHVLNEVMTRSYDATQHGVGSRYLLFKKFNTLNPASYGSEIKYLIDISTIQAKINMTAIYDVAVMARYDYRNWAFDLGYHLNGHSKENHNGWIDRVLPAGFFGALSASTADVANNPTSISTNNTINGVAAGHNTPTTTAVTGSNILTLDGLNKESGIAPAARSHHIFANAGYHAHSRRYQPFIALGGGVSFNETNASSNLWELHLCGGLHF